MKKNNKPLLLVVITLLGFLIRLYGINWDQGFHLHPDERMIVMVAEKLAIPQSLEQIFSTDSTLNPHFFAYGSFPIYLLKAVSLMFSPSSPLRVYDSINLLGRLMSALFDTGSIIIIYLIGRRLFTSAKPTLFAAALYAIAVLPVQLSHFYAVDTILNFFIWASIYFCLKYAQYYRLGWLLLAGFSFGLSLATKASSLPLITALLATVMLPPALKNYQPLLTRLRHLVFSLICAGIIFTAVQPYAFIDWHTYISQLKEQSAMTRDAFVFPYTLQYVGTTAYLYPLKNIAVYGWGIFPSILAAVGLWHLIKHHRPFSQNPPPHLWIITLSFSLIYFAIVGRFSVKFMRYYLPLYPLFSLLAAYAFARLYQKRTPVYRPVFYALLIGQGLWLYAFMNLYNLPNTRVQASDWINQNIPPGATILREHWDDGLPLTGAHKYKIIDLPLYDPDTSQKWQNINQNLNTADYLIVASHRLYVPLSRLADCRQYPSRCYPQTSKYYQNLFSGNLGYQAIATFQNDPQLFGLTISDFGADESFTVYDHPRIFIFKNTNPRLL